jgi:hypothetical protein
VAARQRRHLRHAEAVRGVRAAMTGDGAAVTFHQDRVGEPNARIEAAVCCATRPSR